MPTFERYISKEQRKEVCPFGKTPQVYDYKSVQTGHHRTHSHDAGVVPFKLLMSRDNLYQRMHGLPKLSKEEMVKQSKMYKKKVDFKEFLPNSMANNAKKRMHSNTYLTQKLNLYEVKGGFGNNSEIFDR